MTRAWEVNEHKAIPSDLVREQDFIMRIRRLNRHGDPYIVANVLVTALPCANVQTTCLEVRQSRLQALCAGSSALYAEMSNGDVFLIWPEKTAPSNIKERLLPVLFENMATPPDEPKWLQLFRLPSEYAQLRERTDHYVTLSRDAALMTGENTPAQLLQTEAARGPLTPWSVDQIQKLLNDIDLRRYLKTQTVYERSVGNAWGALFDEYFVSFEELRRAHFPKMEISASDHLFREICQALDRRLLTELSQNAEAFTNRRVSLNLSIVSLMGAAFATFAHEVPRAARSNVIAEINCGDLLQDFSATLNGFAAIRQEGFQTAIDGASPDMLPYLNFARFEADYIKLDVGQNQLGLFTEPKIRAALMAIPREKIIFYHCEAEVAVSLGLSMGVSKFQGWHMDKRQAQQAQPAKS